MADGRPSPIDMEVSWRRSLGKDKVSWLNNFDWNSGDQLEALWNAPDNAPLLPITRTRSGRDEGQASVAAFISNCGAMSPRLELLNLLQKYIPVDSFGKCAHNKDIPSHWDQGENDITRGFLTQKNRILTNRYKFLLSFENQETEDYVTEKFFHPFISNVLPIVMGAPNIQEYAPHLPNAPAPSFLNVADFGFSADASSEEKDAAAKRLADKIMELDMNDEEYLKHFAWRKQHQFGKLFSESMQYSWLYSPCQVCQSLHQKVYGYQPIPLIDKPEEWKSHRRPTPPHKIKPQHKHEEL
jgi:hypothetical protein